MGPLAMRLIVTCAIGCGGALVANQPSALDLLSLWGIVLLNARITKLRELLYADPALALLAHLPVPEISLFDYQLRRFGRGWVIGALDAAAFWLVACARMPGEPPWPAVVAASVAYAFVIEALAFVLLRYARGLGISFLLLVIATIALWKRAQWPWLWVAVEPIVHAAGWLTPWGWLGALVTQARIAWWWGAVAAAVALGALLAARWAREHERKAWGLHPAWRRLAGRPRQVWLDSEEDDLATRDAAELEEDQVDHGDAENAELRPVSEQDVAHALATARLVPPGQSLGDLGWPGRVAFARSDASQSVLNRLLGPAEASDSTWRWALTLASLPAITSVVGLPPFWAFLALGAILLLRRLTFAAALCLAAVGAVLVWPTKTMMFLCLISPGGLAVAIGVPLLGGSWSGLPMGAKLLGSVPRTWAALMHLMLRHTGLRLVAGAPILALIVIALTYGLDTKLGAAVGAGFVFLLLSTPWVTAHRLIQCRIGEIDLSLGSAALTLPSTLCIFVQLAAAGLLIVGAINAVETPAEGGMLVLEGLVLALVTSALHLALLRHAYRRRIDL